VSEAATLYDRIAFASAYAHDRTGAPWRAREYQRASLNSYRDRKVHCDGRDVGKTSEIEIIALWAATALPNSELLIATQCEHHLFPLMHRVFRRFEENPEFACNIAEVKRTPSWYLRLANGFTLWGRIAGPRGVNFQGMHVDFQIVDEAQELTETSWGEIFQALNGNGVRWVYGVPDGRRGTFYRMTQDQTMQQFNWPSHLNPEFTRAKDAELQRLYGGKSSPGYIHRVLGQHGTPEHGVFDLDDYLDCVYDTLAFESIELGEEDAFAAPEGVTPGNYYLGCDLGFARDPSEFVVFQADGPHLINVLRVHLSGVNYARQQSVIEQLDAAYKFRRIAIDCGNNGRAVAHQLMSKNFEWCKKVAAIDFGASMNRETLPDGEEMRQPIKELMTELIQRRLADRTLMLPKLPARESQYAAHTYSVGYTGRFVYGKGNDHIIDADRCAVYAHWMDTRDDGETPPIGPRLAGFN